MDCYYSLDEPLQKIETNHFVAAGAIAAVLLHDLLLGTVPNALSYPQKDII